MKLSAFHNDSRIKLNCLEKITLYYDSDKFIEGEYYHMFNINNQ